MIASTAGITKVDKYNSIIREVLLVPILLKGFIF
ncbi:hypothetical protein GGGNBK_17480 [Sporosarcina sp. ANT_H38]